MLPSPMGVAKQKVNRAGENKTRGFMSRLDGETLGHFTLHAHTGRSKYIIPPTSSPLHSPLLGKNTLSGLLLNKFSDGASGAFIIAATLKWIRQLKYCISYFPDARMSSQVDRWAIAPGSVSLGLGLQEGIVAELSASGLAMAFFLAKSCSRWDFPPLIARTPLHFSHPPPPTTTLLRSGQ